jgi:hypothetical protein
VAVFSMLVNPTIISGCCSDSTILMVSDVVTKPTWQDGQLATNFSREPSPPTNKSYNVL